MPAPSKRKTAAAGRRRSKHPEVRLAPDLLLKLYAASRYLDSEAERQLHLQIPFHVILQDPLVLQQNPDLATDDRFTVKWEPGLDDGPTSARFAVVDRDASTGRVEPPAEWDAEGRVFRRGRKVLDAGDLDDFRFHQVNVWAILQNALAFYESGFGLGRPIPWGFEGNRLTVLPHAGPGDNAQYDRKSKSLQFFYFGPEEARVYTCLSADIIYHEFGHAVLDGVRPYYAESPQIETGAFHEFLGDISAILLSLRNERFRHTIAEQTGGNLSAARNLTSIAEQFGKATEGRDFLRTASSRWTMSLVAGITSVHKVSQVLTGTMFEILKRFTRQYLEGGEKTSAKAAFWRAIARMQRTVIQPLDLLPPVDVTFRDYALAVLRAEELANPLDPRGYFGTMLEVFIKRGILDEDDRAELTRDHYLHERQRLSVFHDIDSIARSRAAAYRFLHDNREQLYIPLRADLVVADLYDANKLDRTGSRLPRQIVLEYVWKEELPLEGERFGELAGRSATLLCGGTLVFDDKGNVLSWARKPGPGFAADERRLGWKSRRESKLRTAWYGEVAAGEARAEALLDALSARAGAPAATAGARALTDQPRCGFGAGRSDDERHFG